MFVVNQSVVVERVYFFGKYVRPVHPGVVLEVDRPLGACLVRFDSREVSPLQGDNWWVDFGDMAAAQGVGASS